MYNQSLMLRKQKATQPTTKPKSRNEAMEEKGLTLLPISSDMVQGINSSDWLKKTLDKSKTSSTINRHLLLNLTYEASMVPD